MPALLETPCNPATALAPKRALAEQPRDLLREAAPGAARLHPAGSRAEAQGKRHAVLGRLPEARRTRIHGLFPTGLFFASLCLTACQRSAKPALPDRGVAAEQLLAALRAAPDQQLEQLGLQSAGLRVEVEALQLAALPGRIENSAPDSWTEQLQWLAPRFTIATDSDRAPASAQLPWAELSQIPSEVRGGRVDWPGLVVDQLAIRTRPGSQAGQLQLAARLAVQGLFGLSTQATAWQLFGDLRAGQLEAELWPAPAQPAAASDARSWAALTAAPGSAPQDAAGKPDFKGFPAGLRLTWPTRAVGPLALELEQPRGPAWQLRLRVSNDLGQRRGQLDLRQATLEPWEWLLGPTLRKSLAPAAVTWLLAAQASGSLRFHRDSQVRTPGSTGVVGAGAASKPGLASGWQLEFDLELAAPEDPQQRLDLRGRWNGQQLHLEHLAWDSPGIRLAGRWLRWEPLGSASAPLALAPPSADSADEARIEAPFDALREPLFELLGQVHLSERSSLELAIERTAGGTPAPYLALLEQLFGSRVAALLGPVDRGQFALRGLPGEQGLLEAQLSLPFAEFDIQALRWLRREGQVHLLELQLHADGLRAAALASWTGLSGLRSELALTQGRLSAALSYQAADERGEVRIEGRELGPVAGALGQLQAKAHWFQQRLEIDSARWESPGLKLELVGGLDRWQGLAGWARRRSAESAEGTLPLASLASQVLALPLHLAPTEARLTLSGSGDAAELAVELQAGFQSQARGPWGTLLPGASGQLELNAQITGTEARLAARVRAQRAASVATADGQPAVAELRLAGRALNWLGPGQLWLDNLELAAPERLAWIEAPIEIDAASGWPKGGRLHTAAGPLDLAWRRTAGGATLDITAAGLAMDRLPWGAETQAAQLARLVNAPLALAFSIEQRPGGLELADVALNWGPTQHLYLKRSELGQNGPTAFDGELRLASVDAERLSALLPLSQHRLWQLLADWQLAARFHLGEELRIDSLELNLPGLSGGLTGRARLALPLERLLQDPRQLTTANWDLALDGALEQLDFVARLDPRIDRSSGRLEFSAFRLGRSNRGTSGSGRVTLSSAGLGFASGMPAITDLNGSWTWRDDQLYVDSLAGNFGAAPFTLTGQADFLGPKAPRYDLFLHGTALPLVRTNNLRLRADTALHLVGSGASRHLEGRLVLVDGRLVQSMGLTSNLSQMLGGQRQRLPDSMGLLRALLPADDQLTLDVELEANSPIDLDAGILRLGLDPELHVFGSAKEPRLTGRIYLRAGRVFLPASRLEISSGVLEFPRDGGGEPSLELNARTRQKGHDLSVSLSGSLADPHIEVSSVPPLAPRDALVLLSTGLLPDQALTARGGSQTARLLAVYLAQDLSRSLFGPSEGERFLDRLEFAKGRDVAKDGTETLEANFLLQRGLALEQDRLSLAGEYDVYKQVNFGLRWALRWH